jgi:hypothetical protein
MRVRRASFKQSDATKALKAAVAAGLNPIGYRIDPLTGAIAVQFGELGIETSNSFDDLMGARS